MQGVIEKVSINHLHLCSSIPACDRSDRFTDPSCPPFTSHSDWSFALVSKFGVDHPVRRSLIAEY